MPREIYRITDQYALVKRKGSNRWQLEWRENGGPERCTTGTADFDAALDKARELILTGATLRKEDPAAIGLIDILDRYRLQHGKDLASAGSGKRAIALWREFWGDSAVSDVTLEAREKFLVWLRERKLSEGYIRRVLAVGKSALNRAWKRDEIKTVPFIELPQPGESFPHYANREQLVKLLNTAMPDHIWTYCVIRLGTGCRGDAALDLQPFQLDKAARLIRLNPPGRKQTKKYRPVVPLCDTLARHLATLTGATYYVHWDGKKIESIRTTWRKIRIEAKLPAWFAPKVLRHTVATEMRRRGVPGWEASGLLGHHTAGTTDGYAKFDPAYLGKARKAIDAWMRDLAKDVPKLRVASSGDSLQGATKQARKPKPLKPALRLVKTT